MSEFKKYATQYKDKECLKAALVEQGYTVIEDHENAQQLYDFQGRATTYLDSTGGQGQHHCQAEDDWRRCERHGL